MIGELTNPSEKQTFQQHEDDAEQHSVKPSTRSRTNPFRVPWHQDRPHPDRPVPDQTPVISHLTDHAGMVYQAPLVLPWSPWSSRRDSSEGLDWRV